MIEGSAEEVWADALITAAMRGDTDAFRMVLEKLIAGLIAAGVPAAEALVWGRRIAAELGVPVSFTRIQ